MKHFTENAYNSKSSSAVIAEIHNAFDTAGDRLLAEAKAIIAKEIPTDKGKRLQALGFGSTKPATEMTENISVKKESTALAETISYFQMNYPNYKFINEEVVKEICGKYNLLLGDAEEYIGDVPEKNIREIENFKLKEEDYVESRTPVSWMDMPGESLMWNTGFDDIRRRRISDRLMATNMALQAQQPQSRLGEGILSQFRNIEPDEPKTKKPAFEIVAPKKDFNLQNTVEKGYKLEKYIPDPIVLQPVKGGYLIISKWGLEGKDKMLVNEVMN